MYKQAYGRKDFNRNNTQQHEVNPKILRLDKLVLLIDPQILVHYLEKVSAFLRSDKKEMWFPDVTPFLDAFLVRVIRDVQNFTSLYKCLDDDCRKYAEEIVQTLTENKDVFRLDHKYDSMNFRENVLVYKKIFEAKPDMDRLRHMAFARAAMKEASEQAIEPPDLRQAIPTEFKVEWLKAITKFIQDDNQLNIEYPEMSINEADFVYSLVRPDQLGCKVGVGFKALYAPLEEALKALSLCCEVKASFLHVASDRVRLSLEKTPLNKTEEKPKHAKVKNKNCEEKYVSKSEPAMYKKEKLIAELDTSFMKTTLHMIFDFVTSEAEASIVFKNADENQSIFIQGANALAKNRRYHSLFSEDIKVVLRKMGNYLNENRNYILSAESARMDKKTKLRHVTLKKNPNWGCINSLPESPNRSKQSLSNGMESSFCHDASFKSEKQPTDEVNSKISIVKEENKSTVYTDKASQIIEKAKPLIDSVSTEKASQIIEKAKPVIDSNEQLPPPKKELICDNSPAIDKTPLNNNSADVVNYNLAIQAIDTKSLGPRKAKLIEAMSTPMESDIASRMMRSMGWDGGPLGVRGDGIVEPIIPALHLAAKAGLGHVKESPEYKNKGTAGLRFRIHLYYHLLQFLTEDLGKREIEYAAALNKKQKACAMNLVMALSNRSMVHELDEEGLFLVQNIISELMKTGVTLQCNFREKHILVLSKTLNGNHTKPQIKPTQPPQTAPISNFRLTDILKKHINFDQNVTSELTLIIGKHIYSSKKRMKAAKILGHKLLILYRLYTFLMTDEMECNIRFVYGLTDQQIAYVKDLVLWINSRSWPAFSTPSENEIWTEIRKFLPDKKSLGIVYASDNQKIMFLKVNNTKLNSAKEKCDVVNKNAIVSVKSETQPKTENESKMPVVKKIKVENKNIDHEITVISDSSKEAVIKVKKEPIANKDTTESTSPKSDLEQEIRSLEKAILNTEITIKKDIDDLCNSTKRTRPESTDIIQFYKKTKYQPHIRQLFITTDNEELNNETIKKIQSLLAKKLDEVCKLPFLECHGVSNGGLSYSCHNEAALLLINSVAIELNLKTTDTTNKVKENIRHKIKLKFNSFIGVNLKKLFSRMECYNVGLSTESWSVLDVCTYNDYIVVFLEIDDISYEYITESNFSMFAGIDKVRFSASWD